jgi:hypothetical protein
VTISTMELAERTNLSYLRRLAQWTGGESYIVNNHWELEPAIFRDTLANRSIAGLGFEEFVLKSRAQLVISKEPRGPHLSAGTMAAAASKSSIHGTCAG